MGLCHRLIGQGFLYNKSFVYMHISPCTSSYLFLFFSIFMTNVFSITYIFCLSEKFKKDLNNELDINKQKKIGSKK